MNLRSKPFTEKMLQGGAAAPCAEDNFASTANLKGRSVDGVTSVRERTVLGPVDHAAFFSVLDNPPTPSAKLRDAVARHRATVISM